MNNLNPDQNKNSLNPLGIGSVIGFGCGMVTSGCTFYLMSDFNVAAKLATAFLVYNVTSIPIIALSIIEKPAIFERVPSMLKSKNEQSNIFSQPKLAAHESFKFVQLVNELNTNAISPTNMSPELYNLVEQVCQINIIQSAINSAPDNNIKPEILESYHQKLDTAIDTLHTNIDQLIKAPQDVDISWQKIKKEVNRLVIEHSTSLRITEGLRAILAQPSGESPTPR